MENNNETTNETPVTDSPVTNANEPVQTFSNTLIDRIDKLEAKIAEMHSIFPNPKEKIDEVHKISQEEYDKALKEAAEFKEKFEAVSKILEENKKNQKKQRDNEAKREQVWTASGRPVVENNMANAFIDAIVDATFNALTMGNQGGTVPFSEEGAKKAREYLKQRATKDFNEYNRGNY